MNVRVPVVALAVCAVSDLAAVPRLLGSEDVPTGMGIGGTLTTTARVTVMLSVLTLGLLLHDEQHTIRTA